MVNVRTFINSQLIYLRSCFHPEVPTDTMQLSIPRRHKLCFNYGPKSEVPEVFANTASPSTLPSLQLCIHHICVRKTVGPVAMTTCISALDCSCVPCLVKPCSSTFRAPQSCSLPRLHPRFHHYLPRRAIQTKRDAPVRCQQ